MVACIEGGGEVGRTGDEGTEDGPPKSGIGGLRTFRTGRPVVAYGGDDLPEATVELARDTCNGLVGALKGPFGGCLAKLDTFDFTRMAPPDDCAGSGER